MKPILKAIVVGSSPAFVLTGAFVANTVMADSPPVKIAEKIATAPATVPATKPAETPVAPQPPMIIDGMRR